MVSESDLTETKEGRQVYKYVNNSVVFPTYLYINKTNRD